VNLVAASHSEVMHKRTGTPIEVRLRAADGSYRLTEVVGGTRATDAGNVVVLTIRDLTQRRMWEVAANRGEIFRTLIEYAAMVVALVTPEGVVESISGGIHRELGHDPTRVVGRPIAEFVRNPSVLAWAFQHARGGAFRATVDVELIGADGDVTPYELTIVDLVDDPIVKGFVVSAFDVSARREARLEAELATDRLARLLDNLSEIVAVIDSSGKMTYLSGSTPRLLGRAVEERVGESIFEYVHPADSGRVAELFQRALSTPGPAEPFDVRVLHEDGTYHLFEVRASNLLDDPAINGIVLCSRDLSDRKHIEAALRDAEVRFEHVFENAAVGITIVDPTGAFLRVNNEYCRMLGSDPTELLTRSIFDVSLPDDVGPTKQQFDQLLAGDIDRYDIEKPLRRADGSVVWVRILSSVVRDALGNSQYAIGLVSDITEIRALTDQLAYEASHDHLTGLSSRAVLHDHLSRCLAVSSRTRTPVVVLVIDLDDFKDVNDRHGHLAGDEVLVQVARRLESTVRAGDLVVRYGGDEFVAVLHPIADEQAAISASNRILGALSQPATYADQGISASIGATIVNGDATAGQAVARADRACYEAKRLGKHRFVMYDSSLGDARPAAITEE